MDSKYSKDQILELVKKSGATEAICNIVSGKYVPSLLKDDCRQLKYYYENDVELPSFDFIPLWEGHSCMTGFQIQENGKDFFKFYLENPNKIFRLGSSFDAVIADLLSWLWTEREIEDDKLIQLANELEIDFIERFLKEIEIANNEVNEPQSQWEREFRESL